MKKINYPDLKPILSDSYIEKLLLLDNQYDIGQEVYFMYRKHSDCLIAKGIISSKHVHDCTSDSGQLISRITYGIKNIISDTDYNFFQIDPTIQGLMEKMEFVFETGYFSTDFTK
jgi:hypothetical protein